MIDTGSNINLIRRGYCTEKRRRTIPVQRVRTVAGITSTTTACRFPILEYGPQEFNFLEMDFNNDYDGLIGIKTLDRMGAQICTRKRTLTLYNNIIIPIEYETDEDEYTEDLQAYVNSIVFKEDLFRLDHLNKEEKSGISKILNSFDDLFYREGQQLTFTSKIKHRILTKHEEPQYTKLYRYPYRYKEEIDRQIEEMLQQGIIRPSSSPYSAPVWAIPKKEDASGAAKLRVVLDYRKLNLVTIKDKFPIPNMDDILDKMGRAMYFTTLDLAKGFHQLEIHEDDIHKTAFSTNSGHYEWLRLPFGLCNAPATFQRLMNSVLAEFIGKILFVYLDDIIIFSTSLQEHLDSINKVFAKLREANLKIQLDKCEFMKRETEFLGHIITDKGVKTNPKKVEAVKNFPVPKTQTKIKGFLGLSGFYRKFIKDYAAIAKPLTNCLKKDQKINIHDKNFLKAFNKLKALLISDPILAYPDFEKKFLLTTDASNYAIGAVLSQKGHPICYASRTLNGAEINYPTLEKELLAIVWAVKYFRPYLYGNLFTVQTDHQPLQWLHNMKEPNNRVLRWKIKLSEYEYEIQYLPGKDNVVADALSRIEVNQLVDIESQPENNSLEPDLESDMATQHSGDEDNSRYFPISEKPINVFGNQFFFKIGPIEKVTREKKHRKTIITFEAPKFTEDYFKRIIKENFPNKGFVAVKFDDIKDYSLFQETYLSLISNRIPLKIFKASKILREPESVAELHDVILDKHQKTNHRGIDAIYKTLSEQIYYPNLKTEITKVINRCTVCNLAKYDRNPLKLPFKHTETPTRRRELYQVDVWQPDTKTYYLTCIDVFTKYGQAYKIENRTWIDLKNALFRVFNDMGKPTTIKADLDPGLKSLNLKEWLTTEGVNLIYTSSKTGIADVERFHCSINEHIRVLKTRDDVDGLDIVNMALLYYNTTYHSTIDNIPQVVHFDNIDVGPILAANKKKRIDRANKGRKEEEVNEAFITKQRVRKLDNPKRVSKQIRPLNGDHFIETWGNNVKNILYKSKFAKRKKFTSTS